MFLDIFRLESLRRNNLGHVDSHCITVGWPGIERFKIGKSAKIFCTSEFACVGNEWYNKRGG